MGIQNMAENMMDTKQYKQVGWLIIFYYNEASLSHLMVVVSDEFHIVHIDLSLSINNVIYI